ncbi:phytanoyl-CoA dioxygenase family protein [Pseudomaricurvus alkylphenolicus]|uniref:phytanoyl-CoA dioxygenase family protein n=1 Tax=Pseudomaricurvus alkylphenolicus TaxID=1306991 RepID=UPI00141DC1E7|nr:phytanoyl-CoA dioxygenase family protein [Pseudomaricurvus alkylphenolicus]NIB38134.1 phytanoyl-CoA dioxygenase family protein [Pseudomaricurvus alkylphenolicus]
MNQDTIQDDQARHRILENIETLGLNDNLLELTSEGYTVVRNVLSAEQVERAKAAILRRVEKQTGNKVDPDTATADDYNGMNYHNYLIFDDPVFPEILLEPKPLALITYLLGESCILSSMGSHFRGPGGIPLPMHADASQASLFETATVANCNYALTPYSREAGALVLTPGSHRKNRHPTPHESWMAGNRTFPEVMAQNPSPEALADIEWSAPVGSVTMEINPGDAVIFHGNTWHGGWRRELPGTRINLAAYFCRTHIATQERRGDKRYPEVFERYADEPRFAQLMGENIFTGWREEGPDYGKLAHAPTGLYD